MTRRCRDCKYGEAYRETVDKGYGRGEDNLVAIIKCRRHPEHVNHGFDEWCWCYEAKEPYE